MRATRCGRLRPALVAVILGVTAALGVSSCSSVTNGTPMVTMNGTLVPAGTTAPDATLKDLIGADNPPDDFDVLAQNAISDVIGFWGEQYPELSGGEKLPPVQGGFYSIDGVAAVDAGRIPAAAQKNACIKSSPESVIDNAFFCYLDDSMAWDRGSDHLVPALTKQYGDLLAAMVFAHEFGHALQSSKRFNLDDSLATIYFESQADCAAGAFVAAAQAGHAPHFNPSDADIDRALEGFLLIRDSTPETSQDISHGNGFDRLSAFANGLERGPSYCFDAQYVKTVTFTERPYLQDSDYQAGGNQPLEKVLDPRPSDPNTNDGGGGLVPDLNRFWKKAAASVGKQWKDVKIAEADHPKCGTTTESEFGYCPDDNTVYYSTSAAEKAYNSLPELSISNDASVTVKTNQPADFGLATLFSVGWGMAVSSQLFGRELDDQAALLRAVCYTGAYAKDINLADFDADHEFILSPPDMDEATYAMLNLVNQDWSFGARGTTGLQRVQYVVKGYHGGLSAC